MKSGSAIVPLYKKIKSHIIEKIHAGELGPNARVPSEHELVRVFKVSRMTVNRALKELEMEGLPDACAGCRNLCRPDTNNRAFTSSYKYCR